MRQLLQRNIQILSAIIWATTILISASIVKDSSLSTVLIMAAGLHVVMLAQLQGTHREPICYKSHKE